MKKLALVLAIALIACFVVVGCEKVESGNNGNTSTPADSGTTTTSTSTEPAYTPTFYNFEDSLIENRDDKAEFSGLLFTGSSLNVCGGIVKPSGTGKLVSGGSKDGESLTLAIQLGKGALNNYSTKSLQFETTMANQEIEVYANSGSTDTDGTLYVIDEAGTVVTTLAVNYTKTGVWGLKFTVPTAGKYAFSAGTDKSCTFNIYALIF